MPVDLRHCLALAKLETWANLAHAYRAKAKMRRLLVVITLKIARIKQTKGNLGK